MESSIFHLSLTARTALMAAVDTCTKRGDILPRPRSYLQASSLRKELVWASGNRCEHYDGVMIRTRKQSGCKCREAWYGRWSTCRMSLVSLRPLPPLTVAGR